MTEMATFMRTRIGHLTISGNNPGKTRGPAKNDRDRQFHARPCGDLTISGEFPEKTGVSGVPARRPRLGVDNVGSRFVLILKGGLP
jgi:hypothetical protein